MRPQKWELNFFSLDITANNLGSGAQEFREKEDNK